MENLLSTYCVNSAGKYFGMLLVGVGTGLAALCRKASVSIRAGHVGGYI